MEKNEEIKESFCPACIALPLAMAGVGATGAGSSQKDKNLKKWMMIGGIVVSVISILVAVYFLFIKKCQTCS